MSRLQGQKGLLGRIVATSFEPTEEEKAAISRLLEPKARIVYLGDYDNSGRKEELSRAEVLFCNNFSSSEISRDEISCCKALNFIQTLYAGVDKTPFENLPEGIKLASNAGAFSGPVSEHAMALVLACAKRILPKVELMRRGQFDRNPTNKGLSGGICAIIGFGGIGRTLAPMMRAMGMEIHALNRSGRSEDGADRTWSLLEIELVLPLADLVLLSIPLTLETRGLMNQRRLGLMKKDAILVNVARAPIIVHDDLLDHLLRTPSFYFGSDVWWEEPEEEKVLSLIDPLLWLPNVVASPHNADRTPGSDLAAIERAAENIRRYLDGMGPWNLVTPSDYLNK